MCEIYRLFADPGNDLSEASQQEMFTYESYGKGNLKIGVMTDSSKPPNGYAAGKHWMGVTVAMWLEDIKLGILFESELYSCKKYPIWWLDSIFYKRNK